MKTKLFLFTLSALAGLQTIAQNTFPSSGNVGVGTTSPLEKIHLQNGKLLIKSGTSTNNAAHASGLKFVTDVDSRFAEILIRRGNSSLHTGLQFNTFNSAVIETMTLLDGNVGIGKSNPIGKLDVNGNIKATGHIVVNKGGSYRIALNGDAHGYIYGRNDAVENKFLIHSNGNSWFNGGNVGIGTTAPDSKLTVKGKIHAEEVKVDLSVPGPDYVFKEDYDLRTLEETQQYIKEYGHLPNIPSAAEMEENGVELGMMNMKLLEKIEELTLYVIALKRENENQQQQIELLKQNKYENTQH
ncbi:hypothetical protein WIW50_02015 [Flavobacteriaceae bacterium 3-367]|uniref:hypothetical protein n=1 Tax=Eudoraea algarum TaxID=3417568 RepID=UPI003290D745